jgi:HAD superfamily hydrolase (TIGR01509 family)
MTKKAGLDQYLEFILSNEDVTKSKPDPEIYNTAISKLNLKPQQCLVLEDNENGIKAAHASGAHILRINRIEEVNYYNIMDAISALEGDQ